MAPRPSLRLAFGFLGCSGAAARFVPFSDVEELKPHRIADFCGAETFPGPDGKGKLRRCARHFKKRLDDGGDIELGWSMDIDPDSILSLDTEAEHGVRLVSCSPSAMLLDLPQSHSLHAELGKAVVGSRFVHGCEHLGDRHLYQKITQVHSQAWRDDVPSGKRFVRVSLSTQELGGLAHIAPSLKFHFEWMPQEARDTSPYPEMVTDFGKNRHILEKRGRRLQGSSNLDVESGGFKADGGAQGGFDTAQGMMNFLPKQLSNFGWNWDFNMNTTEQPTLRLEVPGAQGIWKIRKPYVRVHAGIYLNFSSQFNSFTDAPLVQWTWGLRGQGHVQARMLGSLNTTSTNLTGADPLMAFKIPVLADLETPTWFDKVEFATGSVPVTMEPGYKMSAMMYHQGAFKGAVGAGGQTQGWLNPSMSYNSLKGFVSKFEGNLTNTTIWPPLWIIFTRQFEMGMMLKPTILMKGDFSGMERATMELQGRPFMNISINRKETGLGNGSSGNGSMAAGFGAGGAAAAALGASGSSTLTIYPIRVVGVSTVNFNMRYKIRITTPSGKVLETSPQENWGQVAFHDHISNFNAGTIDPSQVLSSVNGATVHLVKVDISGASPVNTTMATGTISCTGLVSGICQPLPTSVQLVNNGMGIATLQLAISAQADPEPWYASRVKGITISIPQVIIRQDMLASAAPSSAGTVGNPAESISMHIIQGGQTYVVGLAGTISDDQTTLTGDTAIEFGPRFVDVWAPCTTTQTGCISPRLELFAGSTMLASAMLPGVEYMSQTAMQGTKAGSGFMQTSAASAAGEVDVPSTVSLTQPGNAAITVALATVTAKVVSTLASSMFLSPAGPSQVAMGANQKVSWTVSEVDPTQTYQFKLQAFVLQLPSAQNAASYVNYHQVNGQVLLPVASQQSVSLKCQPMSGTGLATSSAPCVFSTNFPFQGSTFSDGQVVSLLVEWSQGTTLHQLFSPPLAVGGAASTAATQFGRRLLAEHLGPLVPAPKRQLWTKEAWSARIDSHQNLCKRRDLNFRLGAGMMMRGVVDGLSMPIDIPILGTSSDGSDNQPSLTTGWKTLFEVDPKKDAEDLLGGPDGPLCQMGLCSGELPGCSKGGNSSIHIPRMVFNTNRPYLWANQSQDGMSKMFRTAMAYGFSTMPEMLDVAVAQMKNRAASPTAAAAGAAAPFVTIVTPAPTAAPVDWWTQQAPVQQIQAPAFPVAAAPPTAAPSATNSISNAFSSLFGGATGRRLSAAERPLTQAGDTEELPEELAPHQFRVEFKRGVPWIIDRPLLEMMMKAGHFGAVEDIEDDLYHTHGPLKITGFYIDSDLKGVSPRLPPTRAVAANSSSTTSAASLLLAAAGTASLAAFILLRRRSSAAAAAEHELLSSELSGLE